MAKEMKIVQDYETYNSQSRIQDGQPISAEYSNRPSDFLKKEINFLDGIIRCQEPELGNPYEYDSLVSYEPGFTVRYNSSNYICVNINNSSNPIIPGTDDSYWRELKDLDTRITEIRDEVQIDFTNIVSNVGITGDLTLNGDLTVSGENTVINTTTVTTEDNIIVLNNGETGNGVTSTISGIEIDRGTSNNYQFLFDETDDSFKIGESDSLQKVATREDIPTDNRIGIWDAQSNSFVTTGNGEIDGNLDISGTLELDGSASFRGTVTSYTGSIGLYNNTTSLTSLLSLDENDFSFVNLYSTDAIPSAKILDERNFDTLVKSINGNSLLGSDDIQVQEPLVSGTNIKTINGLSLLESGDIQVSSTLDEVLQSGNTSTLSMTVGDLTVTGTLTETSDKSLKENINSLENSLEKVLELQGVQYNKICTPQKQEIGFIAQDVENIVPELVESDKDGIKSVSYGRTVALLVESIKEQQKQIDELKKEIQLLKN